MQEYIQSVQYIHSQFRLENLLCVLLLIARLGDIVTTFLVTPKLKLEMNPIARRLGLPFATASLAVCLIPYYSTAIAVVVLVPSFMATAANAGQIWFARAYGEDSHYDLLSHMARGSRLSRALAPTIAAALFQALLGSTLLLLSPDPAQHWGFWFGVGFLVHAFVLGFYRSLFYIRLFREAGRSGETIEDQAQEVAALNAGSADPPPDSVS